MPEAISSESAARMARVPREVRHVHLIGVAGTAMAALAGMLAERGYRVTGSDNQLYEPTASLLKRMRVEVQQSSAHKISRWRRTWSWSATSSRAQTPRHRRCSRADCRISRCPRRCGIFLGAKRVLMVAGTHGKTTSTAIMAHVLDAAGRDPSMLVGGVAKDFGSNYRLGAGDDFVIEGDEYDTAFFDKGPKFLHYRPRGAILTAVEFDHADIYRDLDHVKSSFRALAAQMDSAGVLVVCADSPVALEVTAGSRARRLTYGLGAGEFRAAALNVGADGAHFSIERDGKIVAEGLRLPIGGRMNVANALGVAVLLGEFGVRVDEIARGLESFRGVVRRQELIGEARGVAVVDDFAHHPTAIRATLAAVAERFAGRRIVAAFEPRSNTARRNVFQAEFAAAFDRAARVYLAPVYFKDNDPIPADGRLSIENLASDIGRRGPAAFACASTDDILARMLDDAHPGDVALIMSNGPFGNLKDRLLAGLEIFD